GTRRLPDAFPADRPVRRSVDGYSLTEVDDLGRLLSGTWQYDRRTALPNMGLGLTVGNSHSFGADRRVGYLFSFDYNASFQRRTSLIRPDIISGSCGDASETVCEQSRFEQEVGQLGVLWGTLGNVSVQLGPNHELTALTFFNRNASDRVTFREGYSQKDELDIESWQLQFVGRSVLFNQLLGDHRNLFGTRLRLRWNVTHSSGRREEPDTRTVVYADRGGAMTWYEQGRSGHRYFGDLRQQELGGGISLRFPLWQEAWATVGGQVALGSKEFNSRAFKLRPLGASTDFTQPAEQLFCPDCQDVGIGQTSRFEEVSTSSDGYRARQDLYAPYLQFETPLGRSIRLLAGARVEAYVQEIQSEPPWTAIEPTSPPLDRTDVDVLPAAQLVFKLSDAMYLRGGYGQTVSRPQARELVDFLYYDFVRSRFIKGNPELERTRVHNVDLRWEWFFGTAQQTTELLAISAFYKKFIDPIELQFSEPVNRMMGYTNADGAQNFGVELEGQLALSRVAEQLRFFSLHGNLSILYSRVEFSEEAAAAVTNRERPLFGQSPYVANLSLRFDEPDSGVSASLVYNVVGPRITSAGTVIGTSGVPDEEQQAFHSLDLVAAWRANEHLTLKLKAQNLLFETLEFHVGDMVSEQTRFGSSFSVGLDIAY
ncbi:MAG: TonB-dependent receptor, partial [Polyangiaceae bacterium]|nr:TonB-dependent receptor [Polyangiaceae bacterium]